MSREPIQYLDAEILNRPKAWPRTALTVDPEGKPRPVNPREYKAWKREVASKLQALARFRSFPGEVSVSIDVKRDRLQVRVAALDEDDPRRPATGLTGDVDNYAKAVLDALQASGVLPDDVAVAELTVRFRP